MSATTWRIVTLPCRLTESCLRPNCTPICNYVEKIQAKGVSLSDLVFAFCCHFEVAVIYGGIHALFKCYKKEHFTIHCYIWIQIWPCKFKKIHSWALSTCLDHFSERSYSIPSFFYSVLKFLRPNATAARWQRMSDSYLYRNSHGESYFCNCRDISFCKLYPLTL
jgi:hypothetical protein